jgi:hypothetical protein
MVKVKGTMFPFYAMKACRGIRDIDPFIHNLDLGMGPQQI